MARRMTRFLNLERAHASEEKPPAPHKVEAKTRFTRRAFLVADPASASSA